MTDAARELRPDLKVLFVTGYAENAVLSHGHPDHGMGPDGAFITGSDILMDGGVTASYFYGLHSSHTTHTGRGG